MRIALWILTFALAACGTPIWKTWPVTTNIAAKGTYAVSNGTAHGEGFLVGENLVLTGGPVCQGNSLTIDVAGGQVLGTIIAVGPATCLVRAKINALSLTIANAMPRAGGSVWYANGMTGMRVRADEITTLWQPDLAGTPVWDGCGVIGMAIGPRPSGYDGTRIVELSTLRAFLVANHVKYRVQPDPPGDVDLGGHAWPTDSAGRTADGVPAKPTTPEVLPKPIPRGGSGSCR